MKMSKAAWAMLGLLGTIIAAYIGVSVFFLSHYLPNTYINEEKVTAKTPDYVEGKMKKAADQYVLTITDRLGNSFPIAGNSIGYQYVPMGEEEAILKKQNAFSWPLALFKDSSFVLGKSVDYNENFLEEDLYNLELFSADYISLAEDAHIEIDKEHYELVPEVMGNNPDRETILNVVKECLTACDENVTLNDACYINPNIYSTSEEIAYTANQIEHYLAATIHYEIDGVDENLGEKEILAMLDIDADGNVTINDDAVTRFVQHLASTYNTYADVREFKTSSGDTIKIGGGDYGWVISKAKEKAEILAQLESGQATSREPVYEQRAKQSGLDDIGNTYVEIDYTKQHLWFYKDGELIVDTDIVSGCLAKHNGSVDGVFKIVYKEKDATLVGEDYSSSVKYFMPFAYNIGIHDASWRSKFGGEIYKKNGSHGCVNAPYEAAKKIFENIEVGTPVVAYYREKVELTNNAAMVSNAYSYVKPKED